MITLEINDKSAGTDHPISFSKGFALNWDEIIAKYENPTIKPSLEMKQLKTNNRNAGASRPLSFNQGFTSIRD